jgi:hypothetical protein
MPKRCLWSSITVYGPGYHVPLVVAPDPAGLTLHDLIHHPLDLTVSTPPSVGETWEW